jgi:hypothetical protein
MLIVQKYHSFTELDWEHRTSLIPFLSEDIPSWDWLLLEEKKLKGKGKIFIFLFFCDKHNIPVGLAVAALGEIHQKHLGIIQKLSTWSGKSPGKLSWLIPGLDISSSFHPEYEVEGFEKLLELGSSLQKKDPFDLELFKFSPDHKITGLPALSNSCFSLPFLSFNEVSLHQLHQTMNQDLQHHIKQLLQDQKEGPLKFHSKFNPEDHVDPELFQVALKAQTKFIALTYEDRPLFIGHIWKGASTTHFFDYQVKPAGGEKDLKYYYYFFLYKLSELCPELKNFKKLQFLKTSLYAGISELGFTETKKKDFIISRSKTSFSDYSLINLCHENKRTAF